MKIYMKYMCFITILTIPIYTSDIKVDIKNVSLECDFLGYPTIQSIQELVHHEYFNTEPLDHILVEIIRGGNATEHMYVASIQTNDHQLIIPMFFLKISKQSSSTKTLIIIQEGPIAQKLFAAHKLSASDIPNSNKHLPIITWLKNIFSYTDTKDNQRYIEVTPAAKGTTIHNILNEEDEANIEISAYAIGQALGAFHQLFIQYINPQEAISWLTVCHGDCHMKNILFDTVSNKVYFIDNDLMQEASVMKDIQEILTGAYITEYLQENPSHWPLYKTYCLSFLKAYIQTYPSEKRPIIISCIKKNLKPVFNTMVAKWKHKK
jgi:hypothetical protein